MEDKNYDIILTVNQWGGIETVEVTDSSFIPHGTGSNHLVSDDPIEDVEAFMDMKVKQLIGYYLSWHKANQKANK